MDFRPEGVLHLGPFFKKTGPTGSGTGPRPANEGLSRGPGDIGELYKEALEGRVFRSS